jgi:hypothetical protein
MWIRMLIRIRNLGINTNVSYTAPCTSTQYENITIRYLTPITPVLITFVYIFSIKYTYKLYLNWSNLQFPLPDCPKDLAHRADFEQWQRRQPAAAPGPACRGPPGRPPYSAGGPEQGDTAPPRPACRPEPGHGGLEAGRRWPRQAAAAGCQGFGGQAEGWPQLVESPI